MNFSSENFAGCHPEVLHGLICANAGFVPSYGKDQYTQSAQEAMCNLFKADLEAHFTFNGTGANIFGLTTVTERHSAIYCSDIAHVYVDESTAPEALTGCRLYPVRSVNGKICIDELKRTVRRLGDIHHPQAKVVSITQPTEYGTVYSVEEMLAIKAICREHNMFLHVDGARFFNAVVHLGVALHDLTAAVGVDVLTLGGTKAGLMFGEAVLFFTKTHSSGKRFILKRSTQLASKNRFIAAQFQALFKDDLWRRTAAFTNGLAKLFEQEVRQVAGVKLAYPVQSNAVFLNMKEPFYQFISQRAGCYLWNREREEVRFIFSFNNTPEDVTNLVSIIKEYHEL